METAQMSTYCWRRHTILSLYNGTLFSSEWSINVCSKKPVAKDDLLDDYDNIEYRRLHIL